MQDTPTMSVESPEYNRYDSSPPSVLSALSTECGHSCPARSLLDVGGRAGYRRRG
jgi:hypothetical protein